MGDAELEADADTAGAEEAGEATGPTEVRALADAGRALVVSRGLSGWALSQAVTRRQRAATCFMDVQVSTLAG